MLVADVNCSQATPED